MTAFSAFAAELPGGLSVEELKRAGRLTGYGSIHRAWTAPDVPNENLGLNVGVESAFFFRNDLNDLGNHAGVAPRIMPVPRLWASWDLPWRFTLSGSFSPGMLYAGITTYGLAGQTVFYRETDPAFSMSAVVHYTYADTFGDIENHVTGLALQIARDLDVWQPYLGVGFVVNNVSNLSSRVLANGVNGGPHTLATSHVYAGFRLDMVAKLGIQADLFGMLPGFSLVMYQAF